MRGRPDSLRVKSNPATNWQDGLRDSKDFDFSVDGVDEKNGKFSTEPVAEKRKGGGIGEATAKGVVGGN